MNKISEKAKQIIRDNLRDTQAKLKEKELKELKELLKSDKKPIIYSTPLQPWKELLKILQEELSTVTFDTWFATLKPLALVDNKLIIRVENDFQADWVKVKYSDLLEQVYQELTGQRLKFHFLVASSDLITNYL